MKKLFSTLLLSLSAVLALGACSGGNCDVDYSNKDHSITFESNGVVYAYDLPGGANTNETVSFKLTAESGYEITDVGVWYLDKNNQEQEVELSGSLLSGYSFRMPNYDVTVRATGLGAYFRLWFDPNTIIFTDYLNVARTMNSFWHGVYEERTGTPLSVGLSDNYVQAGQEVLLVAERPYTATNIKFYANGEELKEVTDSSINAGYYAFAFTMPTGSVELTCTAESKYVDVSLDNKGVVDAYLYSEDNSTPQYDVLTSQSVTKSVIYVNAELTGDYINAYSIETLDITYNQYKNAYSSEVEEVTLSVDWSSTDTDFSNGSIGYVNDTTKKFTIASAYYVDNITVTFTIKDLNQYKGRAFVGTWVGYEFYLGSPSGSYGKDPTRYTIVIDGSDEIYSETDKLGGTIRYAADDNTITLEDGRLFVNNGKVGLMSMHSGVTTNNVFIGVNGLQDDDTMTFDSCKTHNTNWIYVIRIIVNDEFVGAVYANNDYDPYFYVDVQIEFTNDATTVSESGAAFIVYDKNGNYLDSVGQD